MRMRPAQRMLVQLSRHTTVEQLELLMELTGAGAGVRDSYRANTIGYLAHLKSKHKTLREFLNFLIAALRDSELQSLYHIIEKHDGDCEEGDLSMNPDERCCPSLNENQTMHFMKAMQKINGHILEKDFNIIKTISPINESEKEGVCKFSVLCSKMKDCGCISEHNVEFLQDVLGELNLAQPLAILTEYEKNIQTPPCNPNFHPRRNHLHRQEQVRERPGPSHSSGRNYKSHSAPEGSLRGHSSIVSSGQGDLHPQTRVAYNKNMSVPNSERLAHLRDELDIRPDPIYPSGMSGYISLMNATSSSGAASVPPASGNTEVVPSAPPRDNTVVAQAPPPVSDSQVMGNCPPVGLHGSPNTSSLRGPINNRNSLSQNPNAFRALIEEPSSLSTYDSKHSFPPGQPTESTQRQNIASCSSILHGNRLEESVSHNEDLCSTSSYQRGDFFGNCKSRENSGPSALALPSHHPLPRHHQGNLPPRTQTISSPGEGTAHSQAPGLHPSVSMNENHGGHVHSFYPSSLRSSAVAGIPSRSLGASTLSESGNVVGHPSSSSGETAGVLAYNRLYPSLHDRTSDEGSNTVRRKRNPVDIHREDKRIKLEENGESEEDYSTPPESPGGPTGP